MASIERYGDGYRVRWRNPGEKGQRSRRAPDHATARQLQRAIEQKVAVGEAWEPPDAQQVPVLLDVNEAGEPIGLFAEYMETVVIPDRAASARRHYDRVLRSFAEWLARTNPRRRELTVDLVDAEAIEEWAAARKREGLAHSTARLYAGMVRTTMQWARRLRRYREWVEPIERLELGRVSPPPRTLAPSWAQMDAVIHAAWFRHDTLEHPRSKQGAHWRARLVTLLRFTGLRVEQAMGLRWDDLDLDTATLHVRPDLGKSQRERAGRFVPISAHLVEELATWGVREGYLIAPMRLTSRYSPTREVSELWREAGVPQAVWAPPEGRKKGNPHHAFRKGFKTGLATVGVAGDVRDYLVGHHRGIDETYVGLEGPARDAVALIPPITDEDSASVIELPR